MRIDSLTIAVDFDGTIVEDEYPRIGKSKRFAFETLKRLQKDGHLLILWTYRSGSKLDEAVAFCSTNGIEFYAVNKSFPEEEFDESMSRKINADLFIDDRNLCPDHGWGEIYQKLAPKEPHQTQPKKRKSVFSFFRRWIKTKQLKVGTISVSVS